MPTDVPPRAAPRAWWALPFLLLPALLTSMDISILFVASRAVTEALQPTPTQWLWMMDVYGFVLAGLLITMGSLGDRIGRRRILLVSSVLFGAASAGVAFAPTPEAFILARVLLGVAAASLAPSTLSLIRSMFADPRQRATAVGAWTVAFTGGAVAGPIIGGLLLEHFWWGSVFLINVPVMLLLLLTVPFLIEESRNPHAVGFDVLGALVSLIAVLGLVFGVKRVVGHGLDTPAVAALATGALLLVLFVRRQGRAAHPLIDIGLFARPAFGVAVSANTVVSFSAAGLGLLAFTFLQTVHALSPLHAALWALPTFLGTLLGAALATGLAPRVRPAHLIAAGLLVGSLGFGVVGLVGPHTTLLVFVGGYTVVTFGIGVVGTVANGLVLTTAPPERAGAAAGISETSTELGAALGIATLGTVATAVYQGAMSEPGAPDPLAKEAAESVTGAAAAAERLAEPAAGELVTHAFDAFTTGLNASALTGAGLLALVAVIAAHVLRGVPATPDTDGDGAR